MSIMTRVTADSIELVRATLADPNSMLKAAGWSQPTGAATLGIQGYDLEVPAKSLFPVITPLRNKIARRTAGGGAQANWKAFTGINVQNLDAGVSDGNRGGIVTSSTADYFAAFRQVGLEDFVTWGAQLSAGDFIDLRARAQTNLLWALMIAEEKLDLGGNTSLQLGQPGAPSLAALTTGGALGATATISVIVAPLSLQGYFSATVAGGVRGQVTRTNADNSTDTYGGGTGRPSANATVVTSAGNTNSVTAAVAPIAGAFGYAWFWGPAGAEVLGAITTLNSTVITANAAGTQLASSLTADYSTNGLVYDGLLTQIAKPGSGSYVAIQPTGSAGAGTPLTADGVGGVVEIDAALQSFWDNYRLSPDCIWVNSQEQRNITKKVLDSGSNGAQRFMIQVDQGEVKGGDLVVAYLNKFSMDGAKPLPVKLHPNLPPGTLMFQSDTLPYPLAGIDGVLVKRLRQDYWAQEWPMQSRKYEYGTYFDGVLQCYAPFALGMITNIGNG